MVDKYAMLSNVKSLELASKELDKKIEKIQELKDAVDYFAKVKGERENEIKQKIKDIKKLVTELEALIPELNGEEKPKILFHLRDLSYSCLLLSNNRYDSWTMNLDVSCEYLIRSASSRERVSMSLQMNCSLSGLSRSLLIISPNTLGISEWSTDSVIFLIIT